MENIKFFTEKLKACVSCDEAKCPIIKERLDRHVLSHHTSFKRSVSLQSGIEEISKGLITSRNRLSIFGSDEQTSTSDLIIDKLEKITSKGLYKESLRKEICDWSKKLPKYRQESKENLKHNMTLELIEKIYGLSSENYKSYDIKLANEIDKFLDSLPVNLDESELAMNNFKEDLINRISELNGVVTSSQSDRINKEGIEKIKKRNGKRRVSVETNTKMSIDDYNPNLEYNKNKKNRKIIGDVPVQNTITSCTPICKNIFDQLEFDRNNNTNHENTENTYKYIISKWLSEVIDKNYTHGNFLNQKHITDVIYDRLFPILDKKISTANYKLLLKIEITNLLIEDIHFINTSSRTQLNNAVEDLTVKLLCEKAKRKPIYSLLPEYNLCKNNEQFKIENDEPEINLKPTIHALVAEALEDNDIYSDKIKNNIATLLIENIMLIRRHEDHDVETKVFNILSSFTTLPSFTISELINILIENIRKIADNAVIYDGNNEDNDNIYCSSFISVYKSEHEIQHGSPNYQVTSTPKRKPTNTKHNQRLNQEERLYFEKLSALITAWINVLPQRFNELENKYFKTNLVNGLAEDIIDLVKLEQLSPEICYEKEKYISYIVFKWLSKFNLFNSTNEAKPYIDRFIAKLREIPIPLFAKTLNENKISLSTSESTVPLGLNMIETEISNWMNNHNLHASRYTDERIIDKITHVLALKVHDHLIQSRDLETLLKDVNVMLKNIITPGEQKKLKIMVEDFKSIVQKLSEDSTLAVIHQSKLNEMIDEPEFSFHPNNKFEPEKILKNFLLKYIDKSFDMDNVVTRNVFSEILKTELLKLSSLARNEDISDFSKELQEEILVPDKLAKELRYINIISDWLKVIPIHETFNTAENKFRVEFVNNLAMKINEIEESRLKSPLNLNYDTYLVNIVHQFIQQLPIRAQYDVNTKYLSEDLVKRIITMRQSSPYGCCKFANQINSTINESSISEQNLNDFIEMYILENGKEIADDELKLEAWSARIYKETEKLIKENKRPLTKSQVFNKLASINIPIEDPVQHFSLELEYAKEISDWLNNLPLLPLTDKTAKDIRVKMISALVEKISEGWDTKNTNSNNTQVADELEDYITEWILELPVDTTKQIVMPFVIQQLTNRIKRVNYRSQKPKHSDCILSLEKLEINEIRQDPGTRIVEAIEKWCANLPLEEDSDSNENLRKAVSTKLFQKIGELNRNQEFLKDNLLYKEILSDEINLQIEKMPHNEKLNKMKENLKRQLLEVLLKNMAKIKERASVEDYKRELENTIEMSLPYPLKTNGEKNPSLKMYKNHLATLFILQSFDKCNDDFKISYENKIKTEIEKYFQDIKATYAIPYTIDQFNNEIYGALLNVAFPNKDLVAEEVEKIKTCGEIKNWFESLPLKASSGAVELLEWDSILEVLAKRLHDMEINEQSPHNKMYKEITKWLRKFPLLPEQEVNVDMFANDLLKRLKSTTEVRKCSLREFNKETLNDNHVQRFFSKVSSDKLGTFRYSERNNNLSAGPSHRISILQRLKQPSIPVCCQSSPVGEIKPSDVFFKIIETWCQELPLPANTPQEEENIKVIKDNLVLKINQKISELNTNPETFENELLYDAQLDDELEKIMTTLPTSFEFLQSQNAIKCRLKDAIKYVKNIFKEEAARCRQSDEHNINESNISYPNFERDVVLSSSVIRKNQTKQETIIPKSPDSQFKTFAPNNITSNQSNEQYSPATVSLFQPTPQQIAEHESYQQSQIFQQSKILEPKQSTSFLKHNIVYRPENNEHQIYRPESLKRHDHHPANKSKQSLMELNKLQDHRVRPDLSADKPIQFSPNLPSKSIKTQEYNKSIPQTRDVFSNNISNNQYSAPTASLIETTHSPILSRQQELYEQKHRWLEPNELMSFPHERHIFHPVYQEIEYYDHSNEDRHIYRPENHYKRQESIKDMHHSVQKSLPSGQPMPISPYQQSFNQRGYKQPSTYQETKTYMPQFRQNTIKTSEQTSWYPRRKNLDENELIGLQRFPSKQIGVNRTPDSNFDRNKIKEPSPFALPSQTSLSTPLLTPSDIPFPSGVRARRPSILLIRPTHIEDEANNFTGRLSEEQNEAMNAPADFNDKDEDKCECLSKIIRRCKPICQIHARKYCRLCNNMNRFRFGMNACTYRGFHYY